MRKGILFALSLLPFSAFGQIELEPLTVKKLTLKENSFLNYLSLKEKDYPLYSLEELLEYIPTLELKSRASFGLQQDLSIRGSLFEDNRVSLAGINLGDPQTGHFNLELPLTSADLEAIEVGLNSQRINFLLKKPQSSGGIIKSSFGQHALWENLYSTNFALGDFKNRFSLEHKVSKGARPDTDFRIYNLSYHSLLEDLDKELEFLFGFTQRDFGADGFYSSRFLQEEEHLQQRFFSLRLGLDKEDFKHQNTFYLRRHRDKFILDRHNPSFYANYHTSYSYGFIERLEFWRDYFLQLELNRQSLESTRLGKHYRFKKDLSLGLEDKMIDRFVLSLNLGFEDYPEQRFLEKAHVGIGYLLKDNLKLIFSFDQFWRLPSFTEKYYEDPANSGNPSLKAQRIQNFETGLEFRPSPFLKTSFSLFLKKQANTIDWVKNDPQDKWQAENIADLRARGLETGLSLKFRKGWLKELSLGYIYLDLDKENPYSFSKYVFFYNQHRFSTNFNFELKGFSLNLWGNFSKPQREEGYLLWDVQLKKQVSNFIFSLEGINIFDTDYQELPQISGKKRWYKLSISYIF